MLNAREDHLKEYYNFSLSDHYKSGTGWVISNQEIFYIRPASYNEKVCIFSSLIEASSDYLLAEIIMTDESEKKIKSVLWSKFMSINLQTKKRQNHSDEFMEFVRSIEVKDVNVAEGLKARISNIKF